MSNLHNFLVEHAMFPFPQPIEGSLSADIPDISLVEAPVLDGEWKANFAIRDVTLVEKLCSTLKNILGDTFLSAEGEKQLLSRFSPRIQFTPRGREDPDWTHNPSETHSRLLLSTGVLKALGDCLWECGMRLVVKTEQVAGRGSSKIDYVLNVDGEDGGLVDAKSTSVMHDVLKHLPQNGIELTWAHGQSLALRMLTHAALYMGLRKMEWLFISSHNYWIVCRLVRGNLHPFLAYSPIISINGSSEPFRALLGAILSVVKKVPVEPTKLNPSLELNAIDEKDLREDGSGNSGEEIANSPPNSRSRHSNGQSKAESGLMVTSSSQNSPESSHVWIHLHTFSNNTLALPQCAKNENRRLWLTRFVGSGSTGNVWQCHFDGSDDLFIAKIVEVLSPADADKQQRLHDEFNIYLTLETCQPHDRIAPRCYGAFEGNGVAILILDLCDGVLNEWEELSHSERLQLYKSIEDLHRIGIIHGDLEPRNIGRVRERGLCLIDFSESGRHICKGSKICSELQTLPTILRKRQPLRNVNFGC